MSDASQFRWQSIVERETLGEPISADDRRFREEFEAEHPECAAETAAWGELLAALADDESEGTGRGDDEGEALAARVLSATRTRSVAESSEGPAAAVATAIVGEGAPVLPLATRPRRVAALAAGIAGITAVAASLALFWRSGAEMIVPTKIADAEPKPTATKSPTPPTIPDAPPVAPRPEAIVVAMAAAGGLEVDGAAGAVGMSFGEGAIVRAEDAGCLLFREPFAALCLGAGAEARIAAAHGGTREIDLRRGRVVATLDPMGPGQSFTVTTTAGAARAIGTIFAVAIDGPAIDVGVVEGKIEVRQAGSESAQRLVAGEAASIAEPATKSALAGDLNTWSRGQAALAELWRDAGATSSVLAVDGAPGVAVAIDGVALPDQRALELLIGAGAHEVSARGARGEPRVRTIVGDPATPTRLARGELLARTSAPRPRPPIPGDASEPTPGLGDPPPVATVPATATIAELRREATQARGERRWQDAAAAYRALIDAYPDAPEADNARYQLGDLLRVRLGRPEDALTRFDAYLARGGPLAAEARLGKIRCLQALGRPADEAAAIAEYLARHPDHLEVEAFRQRARELAGK